MTYKDAIPHIAEIYSEKGYVTERDISLVLIKLNIPMKEIDDLFDVLKKFSLDIRENNTSVIKKTKVPVEKVNNYLSNNSQIADYGLSAGYVPDLLIFNNSFCYGTGRMLSKSEFILYAGAKISQNISNSGHSNIKKNRARYHGAIENNITTENIIFSSSSAAGCFICGIALMERLFGRMELELL